jgi:hypothetical protein
VVAAVVGMAGSVLQIPVAVYLLCRGKRMTPRSLILDVSMYADIVRALDRVGSRLDPKFFLGKKVL